MFLRRIKIGQKFSIAVTLLIALIMLIVGTQILSYQRQTLKENAERNNLALVRNLAKDAVEPLLSLDPLRLDELVRIILDTRGSMYAVILDVNGKVVAHTQRKYLGSVLSAESDVLPIERMKKGEETIQELKTSDKNVWDVSVPVMIGEEPIGLVKVGFSKESVDWVVEDNIRDLRRYIYAITGIIVFLGILGALGLSKLLTDPLKKLKEKMQRVQAGNLDVQVENKSIVKCYERLNCSRADCPAYGKERCWAIAGTLCHGEVQGSPAQKIYRCRDCIVYKETCGDEIGELIEVFNQMVGDLKHNLKKLEEANQENYRLERLSALGQMAATVAHEIKNPLNAIQCAASYLRKNFHGELLTEFLGIIEEEVTRLNEITTGFLWFSKPAPLNSSIAEINGVIKNTIELIRQEAIERNVEVVVDLDNRMPLFSFDYAQIKQALLNLFVNSLDATQPGGTITVFTEAVDSTANIVVKDTGAGIKKEDIGKIFKPFFTTKTRGSGLGLAIAERIVKEHNGYISVESEEGRGSTFRIALPISRNEG